MARQLKTIVRYINENSEKLRIRATIEASFVSTDQKIAGTRCRRPGKGIRGQRVQIFYLPTGEKVLDHNSAYEHHTTRKFEEWLSKWEQGYRRRHTFGEEFLEPPPKPGKA